MEKRNMQKNDFVEMVTNFKSLTIGDPYYFEESENGNFLCLIRKRVPKMDMRIDVTQYESTVNFEGKELTYETIEVNIIGVKYALTENLRKKIMETLKADKYHPSKVSKQGDLGCDTACFFIETEKGWDEFHTGADGYYGNYFWYKDNDAFRVSLTFDADLFSFEEVFDRITNLFK